MNRRIKVFIYIAVVTLLTYTGISKVNALTVSKDDLGTVIESINEDATFAYIIGDYVFTGDMRISTIDIMLAARSIKVNDTIGKTKEDNIYNEMRILKADFDDFDEEGKSIWSVTNYIGTTPYEIPEQFDISYVDYEKIEEPIPEVKKYTVTFKSDEEVTEKVEENGKVDKKEGPAKEGYKFLGWYLDDEEYDFDTEVVSDITLIAKYVKILNVNELLSNNLTTNEYYSSSLQDSILTTEVLNNDGTIDNIVLTTILEILSTDGVKELTITYDENDYKLESSSITLNNDIISMLTQLFEDVTELDSENITFDDLIGTDLLISVSLDEDYISENDNEYEEIEMNITGTKAQVFTVVFNDNGTLTENNVKENKFVESLEPSNIPEGKEFEGWYTDENYTTKYDFNEAVTKNMTLYANYIYNPENITTLDGLVSVLSDTNVDEITITESFDLDSSFVLSRDVVINGNSNTLTYNGEMGKTQLFNVTSGNVTINDLKIDGGNKVRGITVSGGKANLNGVEITNGQATVNSTQATHGAGLFVTNGGEAVIDDCKFVGNDSRISETAAYWRKYSADLWIGSQAKVKISNSIVGNTFVNANEYSTRLPGPGSLTIESGEYTNVYVEYDKGNGAILVYNNGTIDNLMVSTTESNGAYNTITDIVRETTYTGGAE